MYLWGGGKRVLRVLAVGGGKRVLRVLTNPFCARSYNLCEFLKGFTPLNP